MIIEILLPVVVIIMTGLSLFWYYHKRKKISRRRLRIRGGVRLNRIVNSSNDQSHDKGLELQLFDLHTLTKATDNFLIDNKLGEGGFEPVYKELPLPTEYAAKMGNTEGHNILLEGQQFLLQKFGLIAPNALLLCPIFQEAGARGKVVGQLKFSGGSFFTTCTSCSKLEAFSPLPLDPFDFNNPIVPVDNPLDSAGDLRRKERVEG